MLNKCNCLKSRKIFDRKILYKNEYMITMNEHVSPVDLYYRIKLRSQRNAMNSARNCFVYYTVCW